MSPRPLVLILVRRMSTDKMTVESITAWRHAGKQCRRGSRRNSERLRHRSSGRNGGSNTNQQRSAGCQSYCDRIEACLVPECPGLSSFFGDEVCDEWCGGAPDSQLSAFAMRECGEFNEVLLDLAPELADYCSDDPIPDACEGICTDFNECGFEIEQEVCLCICRRYDAETLNCASTAPLAVNCFSVSMTRLRRPTQL